MYIYSNNKCMCVFLISPVPITKPLTSELIDTPVFYNLAPRPIKYRVSVPIPSPDLSIVLSMRTALRHFCHQDDSQTAGHPVRVQAIWDRADDPSPLFCGWVYFESCARQNRKRKVKYTLAFRFLLLIGNVLKTLKLTPASHCKRKQGVSSAEAVRMQSRSSA